MFFLLSAFFLFALLAALQRSRKALAVAVACLAGVVCIIVFLTPVRLPDWWPGDDEPTTTTVSVTVPGDSAGGGAAAGGTVTSTGAAMTPGGAQTTLSTEAQR